MKDFFNQELKVNSTVIFNKQDYKGKFKNYELGTVLSFTECFVIIKPNNKDHFDTEKVYRKPNNIAIFNNYKNEYLTLAADIDNYKKNIKKRAQTVFDIDKNNILLHYIECLDDLNRAKSDSNNIEGLTIIINKNINILNNVYNCITIDEYVGEDHKLEFNPDYHEAIMLQPTDDKKLNNTISSVIQEGYIFKNGKLLRQQKVVVYKYKNQ